MLIKALPYPGYTWSLSQHAAGFDQDTVKGMLICALPYVGSSNIGSKVTDLMVKAGLLTANYRDGKADAWRDYQQILSELGLIVSTKLSPKLQLTEVSKAFIADEISFPELMTHQVLRYQYPNGQKHDRSTALKEALTTHGIPIPDSLIDLQVKFGVLVKPGLLVLQALLMLLEEGHIPCISADECRAILVPCKTNDEAAAAVRRLLDARSANADLSKIHQDQRLRRNIQDWFKLLETTGLFETDGRSFIRLTSDAKLISDKLRDLCSYEARPKQFWLPSNYDKEARLNWFSHFGRYVSAFEAIERDQIAADGTTLIRVDDDDEQPTTTGPLRLMSFDKDKLFQKDAPRISNSMEELAASVKNGAMKRHAKALLHDQIVLKYAERFKSQGADVMMDPNSVDIFAKWSSEEIAIFEVKTVSHRSLASRLRLAVGQVKEYAFRMERDIGVVAEQVIIIDRVLKEDSWQRSFLNDYMKIGLICSTDPNDTIYSPDLSVTAKSWSA